jgi:hypothetical protein
MKYARFTITDSSICARRLGGVLTKEQFRELQRRMVHKPNLQTVYGYIGELHPNAVIKGDDDGYIANAVSLRVTVGETWREKVAKLFGFLKKK